MISSYLVNLTYRNYDHCVGMEDGISYFCDRRLRIIKSLTREKLQKESKNAKHDIRKQYKTSIRQNMNLINIINKSSRPKQ